MSLLIYYSNVPNGVLLVSGSFERMGEVVSHALYGGNGKGDSGICGIVASDFHPW